LVVALTEGDDSSVTWPLLARITGMISSRPHSTLVTKAFVSLGGPPTA
jgi:hypothetical protein